jgi:hypothetical protein
VPDLRAVFSQSCDVQNKYGVQVVAANDPSVPNRTRIFLQGRKQEVALVLELLDFCLRYLVGRHV